MWFANLHVKCSYTEERALRGGAMNLFSLNFISFFFQAIQIIIAALILCLSASVLQIHEVHFTGDVALFLVVVIQVN